MKTVAKINGKDIRGMEFTSISAAKRWAHSCMETRMIILGDGMLWVVRPVDGNRLIKAGFELAR